MIGHLQVQVRAACVPAIAEEREYISPVNMLAHSHLDTSSLQMGISDKTVWGNLKNDVISGNVVQRDRRNDGRSVVGKFVHNFRDRTIPYGKNWLAPAPPILVPRPPIVTRIAIWSDLYPVDGEPFRRVNAAINGEKTAAVVRIVSGTIPCEPDPSVKRRAQD